MSIRCSLMAMLNRIAPPEDDDAKRGAEVVKHA